MGYARYYLATQGGQSQGVERFCWRVAFGNAIAVALVLYAAWHLVVAKYFGVSPILGWPLAASVVFSVTGTMAATRIDSVAVIVEWQLQLLFLVFAPP